MMSIGSMPRHVRARVTLIPCAGGLRAAAVVISVLTSAFAVWSAADAGTVPTTRDPARADHDVAPVSYTSPLPSAPRRGSEQARRDAGAAAAPMSWQRANEHVRAIGGWRSYLREAQSAPVPVSTPTDSTPIDTTPPGTKAGSTR